MPAAPKSVEEEAVNLPDVPQDRIKGLSPIEVVIWLC